METSKNFCLICFTHEEDDEFCEIIGNCCQMELLSVANIEVFEGDGNPNSICKRCRVILSNAYKFKQFCKRSENMLKTYQATGNIPNKIKIIQEVLLMDLPKKEEPEVKEMIDMCIGTDEHEVKMKESSTQTDAVTNEFAIEQMEMIISNDEENFETIPIPPPQLFEDQVVVEQFSIVKEVDPKSSKPKIISNERVKILNKSTSDASSTPKQFKKKVNFRAEKIVDNKPKILNAQLKIPQFESTIIETIEETPDGNIEIVAYDNEEYLEEEQIIDKRFDSQVMDKSEDGVVYTCDVCDRGFPLLQQLEIHKQNHERARDYPCDRCDKAFFSKYDLAKHLLTHTKQKDYTCVVCNKSFSRSTLLYRHEKIHTDPNIPRFHCDHCDRVYLNKLDHQKHQTVHAKNRPFACSYCDKRFAFKQGLERHEVIHDMQSMPHSCQYCSDRFKTPARLQRHLSSSHAGTRAFPCSKCSKRFMLSHHLYRHMRTSHRNADEDITIQCPECEENFSRDLFFDHCLNHAISSLICPMCKYEGENAETVQDHILLHSKSDMYFCDYCSCIFMTQDVLNEHFVEKHSDELCAIGGEDEIEFIVEKASLKEEVPKRERDKNDKASQPVSKKFKQTTLHEAQFLTGASFVEYDEEIEEPLRIEKPRPALNKTKNEETLKLKKSPITTTVQRIKMSQTEIKRLQKEGKIIVQDGMLVMKQ